MRGYESHIRVHIAPLIGDLPLERVNTGHVEAVLAAVPGSAGTRHRVLATLRAALNAAVKAAPDHAGTRAPGSSWNPRTRRRRSAGRPRRRPGSSRYTADDPLGLAFRVMVLRGCRRAELCGFRWALRRP